MKIIYSFLSISTVIVLMQACGTKANEKTSLPEGEIIPVKTMEIKKQAVQQTIWASGQFSTDDETILSFKTGGILKTIAVKEGDYIKKGQLLAALDLTEIEAQVNQAKLGFEKAKRDFERVTNLYKDSVATLEQLQNTKTGRDIAKQQLDAAKFNLNYSEIKAVADGFVLRKFVNNGQLVGPGTPIVQTNGAGSAAWILKVGISDKEWALIEVGDQAKISADALEGNILSAKVIRKSESADPYSGSFSAELKIEKASAKQLASGMFGTATIYTKKKVLLWNVPYEALLDANANKAFVFVTSDNKVARKIPVTLFKIESNLAQITEGLENESSLIVSGSAYLNDSTAISVIK